MGAPLGSPAEAVLRRRRTLLAMGLALWLGGSAPPAPAASDQPASPREDVARVDGLRFEGVESVSESQLREAILTTAPDWRPWREHPRFEEQDLAEDLNRIVAFYRDRGYFDARAEYSLEWNDERDGVRVEIEVSEGEPVRLEQWDLELAPGETLDPELLAAAREALPEPGSVFGVERYREVRTLVLQVLANRGLPGARLEGGAEIDPVQRKARVEWRLDPGPGVFLGEVRLRGLEDVEPHVVLRELAFDLGDPYSLTALRESEKRIFDTGLFRSVSIEPLESAEEAEAPEPTDEEPGDESGAPLLPDGDGDGDGEAEATWPLLLTVSERPPRAFRIGAGYGTEDFFRGQVRWSHRNFLGDARRLSASGKISALIAGGEVELVQPYFLGERIQVSLLGSALRDTPRAYSATRFLEELEFEAPFRRYWSVRWGQAYEWADVTDQNEDFDENLPETPGLVTFPVGLRRTTLDDPIEPTRGTWFDVDVEPSFEIVGSDVNYVKTTAEVRGFQSLGPTVLGLRLRAGALQPWGGSDREDVPVFKRFFAGGSASVRGFAYQKLGPLDEDDDPLGGLSVAEGSVELRFPIWKRLYGVVFSDAGDVQKGAFDWEADDVRYSSGVGLRLRTPVGPIRVDVARLYNPPSGIGRYAYYISVGHAF